MPQSALNDWVMQIPIMQQSVLISAVRGPDGVRKGHPCKDLIRWYRRCVLKSAFDGREVRDPYYPGGGSFTGPIECDDLLTATDAFLAARDELPFHYYTHCMHAFEVLAYQHPDDEIRAFWLGVYERIVEALHLEPEPYEEMMQRLSDDEQEWRVREDPAGSCST